MRDVRGQLKQLFHDADPIRLLSMGAPSDEYDGEAISFGRICETLHAQGRGAELNSDAYIQRLLYLLFVQQFDPKTAGPESNYEALARHVGPVVRSLAEPG